MIPPQRRGKASRESTLPFFGIFIALVLLGLTVADFANDGMISEYLIGANLVLALAFSGYRIDTLIDKIFRR